MTISIQLIFLFSVFFLFSKTNQIQQVQIPGVAHPISLSLAGATGATGNSVATANPHQTSLQIGKSVLRECWFEFRIQIIVRLIHKLTNTQ